jgi:hypothetical protein
MARRRRNGAPENPARSVRVNDDDWNKAVRRAEFEQHTISEIIQLFVKGYGAGLINPPTIQLVYRAPAGGPPAESPAQGTPQEAATAAQ